MAGNTSSSQFMVRAALAANISLTHCRDSIVSLSRRERDGAKRQGEGSNDETFSAYCPHPAFLEASPYRARAAHATLSRYLKWPNYSGEDSMKTLNAIRLALALAAVVFFAKTGAAAEVEIISDVVYGHKDGLAMTLDVIRPKTNANAAAILYAR